MPIRDQSRFLTWRSIIWSKTSAPWQKWGSLPGNRGRSVFCDLVANRDRSELLRCLSAGFAPEGAILVPGRGFSEIAHVSVAIAVRLRTSPGSSILCNVALGSGVGAARPLLPLRRESEVSVHVPFDIRPRNYCRAPDLAFRNCHGGIGHSSLHKPRLAEKNGGVTKAPTIPWRKRRARREPDSAHPTIRHH